MQVQEAVQQTPSLLAPKGAVDAVGSSLVNTGSTLANRIGNLRLGSGTSGGGGTDVANTTNAPRPGSVRDV